MSNKRNTRNKINKKMQKTLNEIIILIVLIALIQISDYIVHIINNNSNAVSTNTTVSFNLESIPEYTDSPYITLNDNKPEFPENEITTDVFENYSELDSLGRCGVAYANICKEIMPKEGEKRQAINKVKPSGWKTTKYEGIVEGNYLYNRCHLIGYQLAGENANEKNLITGTRYMNVSGMLPFEDNVANYIRENKNNHVLYRVTPIFKDNNLVANGVQIEAYSVEDKGEGVCFNVYVYNVQPGINIDYSTGESKLQLQALSCLFCIL